MGISSVTVNEIVGWCLRAVRPERYDFGDELPIFVCQAVLAAIPQVEAHSHGPGEVLYGQLIQVGQVLDEKVLAPEAQLETAARAIDEVDLRGLFRYDQDVAPL